MEPLDQAHWPNTHSPISQTPITIQDKDLQSNGLDDHRQSHNDHSDQSHCSIHVKNSSTSATSPNHVKSAPTVNSSNCTSSRPPQSSSLPNSPTTQPPLPLRIPGTPPANPPPRFFTRPHRRTQDHHSHHHSAAHGSGYGGNQNSSSIGVRSAFKDFVLPAQIILVCSVLNALWPSMLRIVTTGVEFLILVLSSYGACARRSDDCYFLEPLFHDGQEEVYVAAIQWTLRSIFFFTFLSVVYFLANKVYQASLYPRIIDICIVQHVLFGGCEKSSLPHFMLLLSRHSGDNKNTNFA